MSQEKSYKRSIMQSSNTASFALNSPSSVISSWDCWFVLFVLVGFFNEMEINFEVPRKPSLKGE